MAKLTKRQEEIYERVKSDGALMRCDGSFQFLDGSTAHARVVRNLMEKGVIVENRDALFDDCQGQTLRAAS